MPASPDPLVTTTWSAATNLTSLQSYTTTKVTTWVATPPSAFTGLESLATGKPAITISGAGELRLDFGFEHAAWIEIESPDLGDMPAGSVKAAISEYNEPWQVRGHVCCGRLFSPPGPCPLPPAFPSCRSIPVCPPRCACRSHFHEVV